MDNIFKDLGKISNNIQPANPPKPQENKEKESSIQINKEEIYYLFIFVF